MHILNKIIVLCGAIMLTAAPALGREWYVAQASPEASDTNTGTMEKPWKTIQRAVQSLSAGDTVIIGQGVYREQVVLVPKAQELCGVAYPAFQSGRDTNQMTSFVGKAGESVLIDGSDVVTGWQKVRDHLFVRDDWPHNSQDVFCDGAPLQQIAGQMIPYLMDNPGHRNNWKGRRGESVEDMTADSFYVDVEKKKLYVWLADNADPNGHVIEAAVRPFGMLLDVDYLRLNNLKIRHTNTSAMSNWGALCLGGKGSILDGIEVSWCDSIGLHISGSYHSVYRSKFDYNGNSGISGRGIGLNIVGNQTNYNNRRNWDPSWHAGGIKLIPSCRNVMLKDHVAAYNNGSGIWFDSWNSNITIDGCVSHHNSRCGIFYEISERAIITNNICYNNRERGIYLSNSAESLVAHNLVYGNGMSGIVVIGVPRKAPLLYGHPVSQDVPAQNNVVIGNILMDNCDPDLCPRDPDGSGRSWTTRPELILPDPTMAGNSGNVSDYNLFFRSPGRNLSFWAGWAKDHLSVEGLSAWQKATGQDQHSLVAQPLFRDFNRQDFRPAPGSPAAAVVPKLMSVPRDANDQLRGMQDSTLAKNSTSAAGPFAR